MVTDWQPSATREMLVRRAALLRTVRKFMDERGILEVETPAFSRAGATDPNIHSLRSRVELPDETSGCDVWLHSSPEFPMKRLLAAGSGPIYQVARVFRDGEAGRLHQPEFTMLEWYRPGMDHHALMHEINDLLIALGLDPAVPRTYGEVFRHATGLDPHGAGTDELDARARQQGLRMEGAERSAVVEFLFSTEVAPRLAQQGNTFVYDYPAEQAALARIRPDTPPVAERFELFMGGVEIANGFHELGDANEQRRRFLADNARRLKLGRPEVPVDERLLAALANGLPACAGVAVGLDRLLMIMVGCDRIDEVIAFPFSRA